MRHESESSRSPTASRIFADYVARLEAGAAEDFEALCEEHRSEESLLRELREDWLQLKDVFSQLGFSGTITERIREECSDPGALEDVLLEGLGPDDSTRDRDRSTRRYRVHGEIGRGGQGKVLNVWDDNLKRPLAMKVARQRTGGAQDTRSLARLLEEAQITGQLEHPGIVPVHELGLDARQKAYFTMKLVKGKNLAETFELVNRGEKGWTRTRALNVLLRVCEAMAYAHDKGVVHRDLKPANIMVGKFGEVYVMDWGLARILGRRETKDIRIRGVGDEASEEPASSQRLLTPRQKLDPESPLLTVEGDVIGTPAYMSPEQARGDLDAIGPPSDIYSIGAILYQLLSDTAPFMEDSTSSRPIGHVEVLSRVLSRAPTPLASLATDAPAPLIAICEKAMARAPEDRYSTALELAEDLRAFLENRVVQAHETGAWAEARTWVRRNRALAMTMLVSSILGLLGLAWMFLFQARAREDSDFRTYAANVALAQKILDRTGDARRLLDSAPESLRGWEWKHVNYARDLSSFVLRGHTAGVTGIDISPDGTHIASSSRDGSLRVWEAATGTCRLILRPLRDPDAEEGKEALHAVGFSPDGTRVACGGEGRALFLFDVETGKTLARSEVLKDQIMQVCWSPGGRLAAGTLDGQVYVWEAPWEPDSGESLGHPGTRLDGIQYMGFLRENELFVARRAAGVIYDTDTKESRSVLASTLVAATRPNGAVVWRGLGDPSIRMATLRTRDRRPTESVVLTHADADRSRDEVSMGIDPTGRLIATGNRSGRIHVWDAEQRSILIELMGHENMITSLRFSEDSSRLVSGSEDGTVRVWARGVCAYQSLWVADWPIVRVQFLGRNRFAVLTGEGRLLFLDSRTGEIVRDETAGEYVSDYQLRSMYGLPELFHAPSIFTSDGSRLVLGSLSGMASCVDLEMLGLRRWKAAEGAVLGYVHIPEQELLLTGSTDSIDVWSWPELERATSYDTQGRAVTAMDLLPSGVLIWGDTQGWIHGWKLPTGEELFAWQAHSQRIRALAVGGDDRVATGASFDEVRIWSIERQTILLSLENRQKTSSHINSLDFDEAGERLAVGTEDGSVTIWETDPWIASAWHDSWDVSPRLFFEGPEELAPQVAAARKTLALQVQRLFRRHLFLEDVLAALEQEGLPKSEEVAAVRLAQSIGELAPRELAEIAWEITRDVERSPKKREVAARGAEAACEAAPENAWFRVVWGAALHQLGESDRALPILEYSSSLLEEEQVDERASCHAFRALAYERLGRTAEFRDALSEALRLIQGTAISEEMRQALGELLESR